MRLYLQSIVDDIAYYNLPAFWQGFVFEKFSEDKTFFDFQRQGLENALKALWLFYLDNRGDKKQFYSRYKENGLDIDFDYDLTRERKAAEHLLEYEMDYPITQGKIAYAHFINRMTFWMATGSGKTLVIVKLIEILGNLIERKQIPQNDILFLAHREDLLDQFKNHVEEFNNYKVGTTITLRSLKEYESIKRENTLPFIKDEITVYYYRSDLISDEHKEKLVDFRNYDNNGKWYILLDEAHKGDREDSKRQVLYSILSRNGFLFNFSATPTDNRDFATCVFNFNLSRFIEEGFGKHIYISGSEVTAFRNKDDYSRVEKQKIVLKTLILQTYINLHFNEVRRENNKLYHHPLLLALVNSVEIKDADLELLFTELEKVAKNEIVDDLLNISKRELLKEIQSNPHFEFENIDFYLDRGLLEKIEYKDILKQVFNANLSGNIEVLKIPGNKNEIIFKLQTSVKPFALIKIGDISGWLKDKLEGYEIIESFENESIFKQINRDDSEINILMGSRAFYEGWDSNRPNIILFVNIGVGREAKKFVLQSVGRGVRIEPQKNKRKRLINLINANDIDKDIFIKIKDHVLPLESLFVFGTNAENLKEIIKTLKSEKQEKDLGQEIVVNAESEVRLLLIPIFKESDRIFAEEIEPQKYGVSNEDFDLAKSMFTYLGDKVALVKYECDIRVIKKAKESFTSKDKYFDFSEERTISEPSLVVERIFDYFSVRDQELDKYKKLEDEIVHFKKIKYFDGEEFDQIRRKIEEIRKFPEKQKELDEQYGKIPREEFARKQLSILGAQSFEYKGKKVQIKYLQNHYYNPLIVSIDEKVDYINHIIDVESEGKFLKQLEEYLQREENVFQNFDWWMFSKIDQTLDEVYIPYYNPKENNIARFKPDFIFWLQKGFEYLVLFVDPKGTEHTDGFRKIDGYSRIFEMGENREVKSFPFGEIKIKTKLLLKPPHGIAEIPDNYKKYWFDNFDDFAFKVTI